MAQHKKCQRKDDSKRQKFLLSLRASDLKNASTPFNRKPDPFAVVSLLDDNATILGKTRVIRKSSDPDWIKVFPIDYKFGKPTYVKVEIYDENRKTQKHKQIGLAVFEIGEILKTRGYVKAKKMKDGGTLVGRLERAPEKSSGDLTISFQGVKLKNVELFGKADPFYELLRMDRPAGRAWRTVYRSKHIENELNPIWQATTIDLDLLCDGDEEKPIKITVFDFEKNGKHKPIGSFETTLEDLFEAKLSGNDSGSAEGFALVEKGKEVGRIIVTDASIRRENEGTASAVMQDQGHSEKNESSSSAMNSVSDDKYLTFSLQGVQLRNVEFVGKSDPFFELSRQTNSLAGDSWLPVFRSEDVDNDLNPIWDDATIDLKTLCDGDVKKPIKVSVYDHEKFGNHKPMGSFKTTVTSLVAAKISSTNKTVDFALMEKGREMGRIFVADAFFHSDVEDSGQSSSNDGPDKKVLKLSLQGVKLKNMEFAGKSDPFFELSRRIQQKTGSVRLAVYRSKHVNENLEPKWEPAVISLQRLCDGDVERPITVSVYDYEKSGNHTEMGSFETKVIDLTKANVSEPNGTRKNFALMKKGKYMGEIVVTNASIENERDACSADDSEESETVISEPAEDDRIESAPAEDDRIESTPHSEETVDDGTDSTSQLDVPLYPDLPRPSFSDYINGGCELKLCVAIDFGELNGCPNVPGTLHYINNDGTLNDYEKAIKAVGSVVAKYSSDQKFPVRGFGARFCGKLQNCFQVGPNAEAQGIDGVLEGYREMFKTSMQLSGPSVITDVINEAASISNKAQEAAHSNGKQCYTVLLILRNSPIKYLDETAGAILAGSKAPLSIVIVGMGDSEYKGMQYLEGFALGKTSKVRDIIKFVKFQTHAHDVKSLKRAAFIEVPDQLVEYYFRQSIMPNPALSESKRPIILDDDSDSDDLKMEKQKSVSVIEPERAMLQFFDAFKHLLLRAGCVKNMR